MLLGLTREASEATQYERCRQGQGDGLTLNVRESSMPIERSEDPNARKRPSAL